MGTEPINPGYSISNSTTLNQRVRSFDNSSNHHSQIDSAAIRVSLIGTGAEAGFVALQRLRPNNAESALLRLSSNLIKVAGTAATSFLGFERVSNALQRDITSGSRLYERTAMAIPISMLQIAGSSYVATSIGGAVAALIGGGAVLGVGASIGTVAVAAGAAVGAGYLIGLGADYLTQQLGF